MSSLPWVKKPERKPRRSEMRLGKRYEQTVAQKRLAVRPVRRARSGVSCRAVSLLLALALLAALAYVFLSDAFYVYEVTVRGNALVSAEEILEQTGAQGYSVFFINPREVEERISALPDVREAKVAVSLPNHLVIEVRERQARVTWEAGEQRYGVDEEGLIVSLGTDVGPNIVVRDLDATPLQLGEQVDLQAVAAAETYHSLLSGVSEFDYSHEHGLSYQNEHGWRVYLGDGEGAELKVTIVDALVERLVAQGEPVDCIDVRFPESPLYRLAKGSSAEEP
jgi:cell division septal protein FtsQ